MHPISSVRVGGTLLRVIEGSVDETLTNFSGNDSTGHKIWDAGYVLSQLLTNKSDLLQGKTVLELGSGTGIGGLMAAAVGAVVSLTDGASSVLPILESNVKLSNLHHSTTVRRLQWDNQDDVAMVSSRGPFDFIIGSDLLYTPETLPHLVDVLTNLSTQRTEVLLTFPIRFTEPIFFELVDTFFQEIYREEVEPAVFLTRLVLRE